MKTSVVVISMFLGIVIYHFCLLPITIDNRASDLGFMQYNGELNKMVADTLEYELHYLKYGSTD